MEENKKNILIVEDSMSVRKFIAMTLKLDGYKTVGCNDGMEALEKLSLEKFDLIITDVSMPNMDGYKLIKTLREDIEYKNMPIIVLSSLDKPEEIEFGLEAGANSYLIKPFNSTKLIYEVSKYV